MSNIEWTDETWNPVTGCDKVSQGCKNCYAEKMHKRLGGMGQQKYTGAFLGNVTTHDDELMKPFQWKKGKRIFVNSMSDLFHKDVPFEFIAQVYSIMVNTPQHTYQILTKRGDRLLEFYTWYKSKLPLVFANQYCSAKNIWVGVSCEDQKTADERIPHLLQVPAAIRFVSCEPLLGEIHVNHFLPLHDDNPNDYPNGYINWIIAGGESGHKARPVHPDWIRSLRDQCLISNTPFFFKQWGEYVPVEDAQPPLLYFSHNNTYVDGHGVNILDPETGEGGIYGGHRFFDPMTAIAMCVEESVDPCNFWKVGKHNAGNSIDGKKYEQFPTV